MRSYEHLCTDQVDGIRKTVAAYFENETKSVNTLLAKQPSYLILNRVEYSNHCVLKQDTVTFCNFFQELSFCNHPIFYHLMLT